MRLGAGVCLASLVPSSTGAVSSPSQWKVRKFKQRGSALFDASQPSLQTWGHPCFVSLAGLTITLCPAENAQQAKKDAEHHRSKWSNEEKYPLLGSAFYCKSRYEYELEAKQGPSGAYRCVCVHLRVRMHAHHQTC